MDISLLNDEGIAVISDCFLFKGLPRADVLKALAEEMCILRLFEKGDIIYDVHSYRKEVSIILSGSVEVSKQADADHRFVMNTLTAGSLFGAAAVFNGEEEYVTTLTATSRCRMVFLPQALLRSLMEDNFTIAENYITFLSGRIRFLNSKISNLVTTDAPHCLAKYILSSATEDSDSVVLGVSLSTLASMLNMGRASLYRAFAELESSGIITKNGKKITINDFNKLKGYLK